MPVAVEVAGSYRVPTGPRIGRHGSAADDIVRAHFPDRDLAAAGVLPQDVGMAIVVEVASSDLGPTRPRIGAYGSATDDVGPAHLPDRRLTACVLPQDVGG